MFDHAYGSYMVRPVYLAGCGLNLVGVVCKDRQYVHTAVSVMSEEHAGRHGSIDLSSVRDDFRRWS